MENTLTTELKPVVPLGKLAAMVDALKGEPQIECPLKIRFTPGLWIRELHVPKGAKVVTKYHRTEHPFVISKGRIVVYSEEHGVQDLSAPYFGITKPGTIRLAIAAEDTIWTTFHANPTNSTDLVELERMAVLEPHEALAYEEAVSKALEQGETK